MGSPAATCVHRAAVVAKFEFVAAAKVGYSEGKLE